MTTTPRIDTVFTSSRIASTAAAVAALFVAAADPATCGHGAGFGDSDQFQGQVAVGASPRGRPCAGASAAGGGRVVALNCHGCRLSQRRIGPRELGYWRGDACSRSRRPGRQTPAAAGRPRHVLVDRTAGDRVHRAGGHGRDVLISARRNHQGPVPSYDAATALRADALDARLPHPATAAAQRLAGQLRPPRRYPGRADRPVDRSAAARRTSIVGYISPTGLYLSLTQSNADEDKLVGSIHPSVYPTGTVDVDGDQWMRLSGFRRAASRAGVDDPAQRPGRRRRRSRSPVPETPTQFRTLASATQSQPPLPAR